MTPDDPPITIVEHAVVGCAGPSADVIVERPELIAVLDADRDSALGDLAADVIRLLPASMSGRDAIDVLAAQLPESDLSLAIYSSVHRQIWHVGTVQYWWDGVRAPRFGRAADTIAAEYRALRIAAGSDPADDYRGDRAALRNAEGPWGYGTVGGRRTPDRFVGLVNVPSYVDEIVLASDGYPGALKTVESAEAYLSRLLTADPQFVGELKSARGAAPGATSFDDRAYIRVRIPVGPSPVD